MARGDIIGKSWRVLLCAVLFVAALAPSHTFPPDRSDAKAIPIIAMTANAFDEDVQLSLQVGMNAHLFKPVEPERLYETLEELIREAEDRETRRNGHGLAAMPSRTEKPIPANGWVRMNKSNQ